MDVRARPASRPARCIRSVLAFAAAALALAACTTPPAPGRDRAEVLKTWGAPGARHALQGGAERLEYASGPWGRTTWMIDIDAQGRVQAATQVLNDAHFAEFMVRAPGTPREALLRELGRPAERRGGGLKGGETWSWRFPTNDCLWFQVSLDDAARVTAAGYGIDPACDAPSDRN